MTASNRFTAEASILLSIQYCYCTQINAKPKSKKYSFYFDFFMYANIYFQEAKRLFLNYDHSESTQIPTCFQRNLNSSPFPPSCNYIVLEIIPYYILQGNRLCQNDEMMLILFYHLVATFKGKGKMREGKISLSNVF